MAVLAAPPARDQTAVRDADRFELCGETCLASALSLEVATVVSWLRQHEGGERAVHNGTSAAELIDFCHARGVSATLVRGPAATYVAAAAQRGAYTLVLIWSDHVGKPVPHAQSARLHPGGIGHWLLGYGVQGTRVMVMQPFGGTLVAYGLGHGEDQLFGIEIHRPVPAPKRAPAAVRTPRSTGKPVRRRPVKVP